jgi:chromate transporter
MEKRGAGAQRPGTWTILRVWTGIGLQSFGGGASTQLLIWRTFADRHGWVKADELVRFWNLCQITPGINLVALTILIGRKLGGTRGIVAALAGLLLPSAAVTCALAAGFEAVQQNPAVHAILRGVVPATAGIMGLVSINFARPLWRSVRSEGGRSVAISALLVPAGVLAIVLLRLPVAIVLAAMGLIGAAVFTPTSRQALELPATDPTGEERAP